MGRSKTRRITVEGLAFLWTRRRRQRHGRLQERLSVQLVDGGGHKLELLGTDGDGVTVHLGGWGGMDGGLCVGSVVYNLNLPRVVAAVIRGALREGWTPSSRPMVVSDVASFLRLHLPEPWPGWAAGAPPPSGTTVADEA